MTLGPEQLASRDVRSRRAFCPVGWRLKREPTERPPGFDYPAFRSAAIVVRSPSRSASGAHVALRIDQSAWSWYEPRRRNEARRTPSRTGSSFPQGAIAAAVLHRRPSFEATDPNGVERESSTSPVLSTKRPVPPKGDPSAKPHSAVEKSRSSALTWNSPIAVDMPAGATPKTMPLPVTRCWCVPCMKCSNPSTSSVDADTTLLQNQRSNSSIQPAAAILDLWGSCRGRFLHDLGPCREVERASD
jgi:hypothetical protein